MPKLKDSSLAILRMLAHVSTDLREGSVGIRQQNGSAVGIALTAVLFNERTSKQLKRILKKL